MDGRKHRFSLSIYRNGWDLIETGKEKGGDKMLISTTIKLGTYTFLFKVQSMKKLHVRSGGASSRVPGTALHVIFLDYDNITDDRLQEELLHIQDEKRIGNFYVLETRNEGRHAVCIDALPFKDAKAVVDYSSCDLMFKRGPRINEYRCWVLRFSEKGNRPAPKYLYTVKSPYEGKNLQSRSHAKYLMNFGIPPIELKKPVGSEEIETQEYNTGKRTK
jgi:hypothetical protein